jgi:hypothetical protein
MTTVASNLTKFYASSINLNSLLSTSTFTAAQLTPWVDSSGGTDLVVDGFKAVSTTATSNVVSKSSVAYVAGSDDDGQCFSVGTLTNVATNATGATSGVTGTLYVGDAASTATLATTPVLVAKGKSVVLGLTASAAGTYSGYVQRTPAASGVCSATSTGTVTRVFKYTITTSGSFTISFISASVYPAFVQAGYWWTMMETPPSAATSSMNPTAVEADRPNRSQWWGGMSRIASAPASRAAMAWSMASRLPSADTPEMAFTFRPVRSLARRTAVATICVTRARSAGRNDMISPVWPLQTTPSTPGTLASSSMYSARPSSLIDSSSWNGQSVAGNTPLHGVDRHEEDVG